MSPRLPFQFFVIVADSPETLLLKLRWCRGTKCITIRRSMPLRIRNATYLLEEIHGLRLALQQINVPYKAELYNTLRGVQWPHDLSTVPGLWQYPLTFEFLSLTILNLGVQDAALWLIPILAATLSDAPLRRILITHCASWDECLQPFPFEALDEQLGSRPQAKLLIGWATDDAESDEFVNVFKTRLPIANSLGKVGILYSDGPRSVLPPDDGRLDYPEFYKTDEDGEDYIDPFAEGFINVHSWEYDHRKDPLGPIYI